jgi:hypothetical protein
MAFKFAPGRTPDMSASRVRKGGLFLNRTKASKDEQAPMS